MAEKFITLMYHGITGDGFAAVKGREVGAELYDVDSDSFLRQMQYLKDNEYQVSCIEDEDSRKRVVLTFDDGEENNYQNAFVVLRTFGFRAYFFVTANRVGTEGYMTWDELKEMRDAGMIIGAHGLTHDVLIGMTDEDLDKEITEAKKIIEGSLDIEVDSFSVPRGFCNKAIINKIKAAGYKNIFVSDKAPSDNCIKRTAVKGKWAEERFCLALQGDMLFKDKIFEVVKKFAKQILGTSGYNSLRERMLRK